MRVVARYTGLDELEGSLLTLLKSLDKDKLVAFGLDDSTIGRLSGEAPGPRVLAPELIKLKALIFALRGEPLVITQLFGKKKLKALWRELIRPNVTAKPVLEPEKYEMDLFRKFTSGPYSEVKDTTTGTTVYGNLFGQYTKDEYQKMKERFLEYERKRNGAGAGAGRAPGEGPRVSRSPDAT